MDEIVENEADDACGQRDIFAKCSSGAGNFGFLRARGDTFFTRPTLDSLPGPRMRFAGRNCVMWSINDYLGLSGHPGLKDVAAATARDWGVSGPMGSRMMSGTTSAHLELEAALAQVCGKPDAVIFNFGYLGVLGTIQALTGPDDIIIMDKLAHASIVDAARMAVSQPRQLRVFRHNDMNTLERLLQSVEKERKGGVLILAEGIYGMTGDCAPLADIVRLKKQYDARLFIDDAHGFGVVGPDGRGAGALCGVGADVDVYFSTFAKAFASIGGVSAAEHDVVEWIKYNARTQVFARGLPMVVVATLLEAISVLEAEGNDRRKLMWARSHALAQGLRHLGFYVQDLPSPLVPVLLPSGDVADAMAWTAFLREHGVFVSPVSYPVIPRGACLFRLVPTASHSEADVAETLDAFKALRDANKLNLDMDTQIIRTLYGAAPAEMARVA
jgi:glycine C-acetyltransferase